MLTCFANVADPVDPSEAPPTTEKTPGVAGFSLPTTPHPGVCSPPVFLAVVSASCLRCSGASVGGGGQLHQSAPFRLQRPPAPLITAANER